jgi:hypothetical protein
MMRDAARVALRPERRIVGFVADEPSSESARRVRRDERMEEVMAGWDGVGKVARRAW